MLLWCTSHLPPSGPSTPCLACWLFSPTLSCLDLYFHPETLFSSLIRLPSAFPPSWCSLQLWLNTFNKIPHYWPDINRAHFSSSCLILLQHCPYPLFYLVLPLFPGHELPQSLDLPHQCFSLSFGVALTPRVLAVTLIMVWGTVLPHEEAENVHRG